MADGPATDAGDAPFGMPSGGDDERDETVEQILQTVHQLFEAFSNRWISITAVHIAR
jgi:hypothetical protein